MHLNGIAKRITALALGAALLTATALPAFAEGTQQINVKYTYNAIDGTTWEKISHADFGTETNDGVVDYLATAKSAALVTSGSRLPEPRVRIKLAPKPPYMVPI